MGLINDPSRPVLPFLRTVGLDERSQRHGLPRRLVPRSTSGIPTWTPGETSTGGTLAAATAELEHLPAAQPRTGAGRAALLLRLPGAACPPAAANRYTAIGPQTSAATSPRKWAAKATPSRSPGASTPPTRCLPCRRTVTCRCSTGATRLFSSTKIAATCCWAASWLSQTPLGGAALRSTGGDAGALALPWHPLSPPRPQPPLRRVRQPVPLGHALALLLSTHQQVEFFIGDFDPQAGL